MILQLLVGRFCKYASAVAAVVAVAAVAAGCRGVVCSSYMGSGWVVAVEAVETGIDTRVVQHMPE